MKKIKDYIFIIGWILLFLQIIIMVNKNTNSIIDLIFESMIPIYLLGILLAIWLIRGEEYIDEIKINKVENKPLENNLIQNPTNNESNPHLNPDFNKNKTGLQIEPANNPVAP